MSLPNVNHDPLMCLIKTTGQIKIYYECSGTFDRAMFVLFWKLNYHHLFGVYVLVLRCGNECTAIFSSHLFAAPIQGHKHIAKQVNKSVARQQTHYRTYAVFNDLFCVFLLNEKCFGFFFISNFLLLVFALLSVSTFSFSRSVHAHNRIAYMFRRHKYRTYVERTENEQASFKIRLESDWITRMWTNSAKTLSFKTDKKIKELCF